MAADEEKAQSAAEQQQQQQTDFAHDAEKGLTAAADRTATATTDSTLANEAAAAAAAAPADAAPLEPAKQVIPRRERRGLLGQLTLVPELADPKKTGIVTKWLMTVIVATAAGTSSTGTSISYPALNDMAVDLGTTPTVVNLSLAFYLLAMAFTPMWWSFLSETKGRRSVYIISFALFSIFSAASALSVNAAMLIVFRVLSGGASAAVQTVGAGTIADIWEPERRGLAMGVFFLGPLCGPGIAPIIGGALTDNLGWRSTLWFLVIFGGVLLLLIVFCLPETVARKQEQKKVGGFKGVAVGLVKPILALSLLRYPPILIAVYSAAIAFASMYVINISVQADFINPPYNFTTTQVGLLYIAPMIGYAISSLLGGRWIDYIMAREARKANRYDADGKLIFLPEERMKENIWISATLYPGAMIWYGWVVDKGVHWAVSCVANIFFGLGCMLVFGAVNTMLTEFTPKRSSTGVAINNFVRSTLACIGAIVTQPLIGALGTGWTCTMIGLFAWVTGNAAIWALKTWAPEWREEMNRKLNAEEVKEQEANKQEKK
ncbi:major facilitator superfamily domain-containing protein [Chaetomium sp. MPI-SDFR-AT-0129]|nr:major facilitator superfamily domain-containing protein [Chaetomium sp. MPI-SDFR-AT-0129]